MTKINKKVLVSSAKCFADDAAINSHMDSSIAIDQQKAVQEHGEITKAFRAAGIEVTHVDEPSNCQDGVYTANWALIRNGTAVMSRLPNARKSEEAHAKQILEDLGYETIVLAENSPFSGQGDALFCGDYLFVGTTYRTSPAAQDALEKTWPDVKVVRLQTIPELDAEGRPVINQYSGWPDSFFYDLDLALAVIDESLIAWCPDAFDTESQEKIRSINDVEKIEVSLEEAKEGFACNLVSTGEYVIMSDRAPGLRTELLRRGLQVITPSCTELVKGGGFIRCISLTLE